MASGGGWITGVGGVTPRGSFTLGMVGGAGSGGGKGLITVDEAREMTQGLGGGDTSSEWGVSKSRRPVPHAQQA